MIALSSQSVAGGKGKTIIKVSLHSYVKNHDQSTQELATHSGFLGPLHLSLLWEIMIYWSLIVIQTVDPRSQHLSLLTGLLLLTWIGCHQKGNRTLLVTLPKPHWSRRADDDNQYIEMAAQNGDCTGLQNKLYFYCSLRVQDFIGDLGHLGH